MKQIILITILTLTVIFCGLHFVQKQKEKPKLKKQVAKFYLKKNSPEWKEKALLMKISMKKKICTASKVNNILFNGKVYR